MKPTDPKSNLNQDDLDTLWFKITQLEIAKTFGMEYNVEEMKRLIDELFENFGIKYVESL